VDGRPPSRRNRIAGALLGAALVAVVAGCAAETSPILPPSRTPSGQPPSASPPPAARPALTEAFDHTAFGTPLTIDNRWLPLTPGARRVWEGEATVDGERISRRVVLTVTDLTKTVDGIPTLIMYELDYDDDQLVEAELAFAAQDDAGNVWHLGQYPEEYEGGEIVGAPAWLAGMQGSRAGYWMKAQPQLGVPYSQGWGPVVQWTDRAEVFEMGAEACVPAGCYEDVLVIREFNIDEPSAYQHKHYAAGIGNVLVDWAGTGEHEQEILRLVEVATLGREELALLRGDVLAMDRRGYDNSPDVYARTDPAQLSSASH
jgi:hypothetical protein